MRNHILSLIKYSAIVAGLLLITMPSAALAQGRGRGLGRNRDQNWKCGVFVNCLDARDGRVDGRGPNRSSRVFQNGVLVSRGQRVGYRSRYSTNDYWQRRHLTYGTRRSDNRWRYRNRSWRNR